MKENAISHNPLFKNAYLLIIAAWLFTISFIVSNYWAYNSTPLKVQQGFEHYLSEREFVFEELTTDTSKLSVLLNDNSDKSSLQLGDADFGIFLFKESDTGTFHEIYWNTFNMSLSPSDINLPDGYYPFNGTNGFFELLKMSISKDGANYVIASLIPIKWKYFIENKYISNSFAYSNSLRGKYYIASGHNGFPIYNSKGRSVFRLAQYNQSNSSEPNSLSITLILIGLAFVLIFINSKINELASKRGFFYGLGCLFFIVIIIRLLAYWFPIPFNFRSYELFSPLVYASSVIHASLGDLLINVLLFFWITFFIKYRQQELISKKANYWIIKYKKAVGVASLFLFALLTLYLLNIVCSLVVDSKIPLNVTDFFHLNIYTLVTFFILTFIILSYYNLSYFLMLPAIHAGLDKWWRIILLVASGLLIITLQIIPGFIFIKLASLLWLTIYCLILDFRKEDLPKALVSSPYFLFWLMFFAASITMIIRGIDSRDLEQKKWFAQSLAEQSDNSRKSLLNMAIGNFSDFFLEDNFHRMQSANQNKFIKDSLMANNFSGFLNNYDYDIFTFDSLEHPLFNKDSTSFNALNALISTMSKHSNIPNLYVYEPKGKQFEYILRKKITARDDTHQNLGYIFLIIYPKRSSNNDLSNGLLREGSFMSEEAPPAYAYAIYQNRHLIKNNDAYGFSDSITNAQIPRGDFNEVKNSKTDELWYNAGNNMVIVVMQKSSDFISGLTLFAYIFSSFVAFIVLLKFLGFLFQSRFKWAIIRQSLKFKIRLQIHATIIFISAFSFIIIGISTISFFIMRFNKSNQERLTENVQILVNEIQESLARNLPFTLKTPNDLDNFFSRNEIDKTVIDLANMNKQEVNLYNLQGSLKASSQPYIFNKNIVSNKMQPDAYYLLHYKHRIKVLQNEKIGKFQFLSMYVPIYDSAQSPIAYLNVPFLNSQSELEQEISSFLVTVINLNALIFLLAGAIAALLTLRITQSFSVIKDKMRKINVGMENEEISWNRKDEIGDLVKEYNIMVRKLNDNIKALAQSEREGAWKEMAQQVAHEIKNPLTPMKLSLQFLKRAADNNADNINELAKKVPNMLIEQINQLAKIANDFSHFAKIQSIKPERFNVSEILEPLIMLNQAQENVKINYTKPVTPNIIFADKTQINRLFTNLIKNGIEASAKKDKIEISIFEERIENQVLIAVQDNGEGISKEESGKLFEPNFTTKSSGTGLGLAICKGIVENAKGQIWFESIKDKGATFYVSLPLLDEEEEEEINTI
ncbi:MAG TPA: HAMP domain-containing sensor histidine kinase [Arachidicoccus soli]|nr:HAMP domain-containing sensor histidine kinase [Arachidicoccus soli]